MHWFYLVVAGILEVVWAFTMKQSDGFTKPMASFVTILTMIASFVLLSIAMRSLPLGTAYATWTGIGAVGAFVVGILLLGESASAFRVLSVGLILIGIIGLKLTS